MRSEDHNVTRGLSTTEVRDDLSKFLSIVKKFPLQGVPTNGFAADTVAAVVHHRAGFQVGDGGQLDASGPVQTEVDCTSLTASNYFTLGERELSRLERPEFTQLGFDLLPQSRQVQ